MGKIVDLQEKRKKIEKKKILLYLVLIVITIYVISAIYLIIKTPTDTVTIDKGVLTFEESTTGYIIRDEQIVKGKKYKNGIAPIVAEGERAAKGQAIFRYYGDNEEKLQQQIEKVNSRIQDAMSKEETIKQKIYPVDIKNLDDQIEKKISNIEQITDIQKITEIKKEINNLMMKKAKIAGESSARGSYIKKLISEKEEYEKKLNNGSETMESPISGVVSYRVDGLENVLTAKNFENIDEKTLNELDLKTGKIVSTNNESAKVIDNFGCYIAAVLNSTAAKDSKEGDAVKITLSSGNEIDGVVEYKKEQESGKILVIFKVRTLTEELISYRKISFNITWWRVSGLKVPNDAIAEDEEGLKYVLKKTSNGTSKILIKVLKTNNKYSIISKYSTDDLKALGIDINEYKDIDIYDTLMMYPEEVK